MEEALKGEKVQYFTPASQYERPKP
jgi:hypothetical protein